MKKILCFFSLVAAIVATAQPLPPVTTVWSRAFLRQTNGPLVTNITGITYFDNTNYVRVTNTTGTASVIDDYKFSKNYTGAEGDTSVYTNPPGTFGMQIVLNGLDWTAQITNAAGSIIYETANGSPIDGSIWITTGNGSGSAPLPKVVFGNTTNTEQQYIFPTNQVTSFPPNGTNIYVNAVTGSDAFAQRGHFEPGLCFKTLAAAISSASSWDTIYVAPGTYIETVQIVNPIVGLKIIGSGKGATFIQGQKEFRLGNSNYLSNFTTDWVLVTGPSYASPSPATNIVVENLRIYGGSDAAYWIPYGGGIWNCEITGNNDILAFPATQQYMTNTDAAFKIMNCSLQPASGVGAGLSLQGYARIQMNGGQIKAGSGGRVVGGANGSAPSYSTNTVVIINGAILIAPATGQLAALGSGNGVVILTNNCTLRLDPY